MAESKTRHDTVTALKAVAIILVVLGHVSALYRADFTIEPAFKPFVDCFIRLIYAVHIPLFFTLSGYLNHAQPYGQYMSRKLIRILIPFAFFTLLKLIYSNTVSAEYSHGGSLLQQIASAFLYGELYWFCYTIIIVFAAAPLLWKRDGDGVSRLGTLAAVLCAVSVSVLPMFGISLPEAFQLDSAVYYFPFFTLGYCLRHGKQISKPDSTTRQILRYCLCAAILAIYLYLCALNEAFETYFPLKFIAASALMYLLYKAFHNYKPGRLLTAVSDNSLQIMFLDSFFKIALLYLLSKLGIKGYLLCFPIAAADLLMCLTVCKVVERIPFISMLFGLRKPHINNNYPLRSEK